MKKRELYIIHSIRKWFKCKEEKRKDLMRTNRNKFNAIETTKRTNDPSSFQNINCIALQ